MSRSPSCLSISELEVCACCAPHASMWVALATPAWCCWYGGVEDVRLSGSGHDGDHAATRNERTKGSACTSLLDNAPITTPLAAPRRHRGVGYPTLYWLREMLHTACMWESSTACCSLSAWPGVLLPRDPLASRSCSPDIILGALLPC